MKIMELYNDTVIFTRREKRALAIGNRIIPTTRLPGLWDNILEAHHERQDRLPNFKSPRAVLVLSSFMAMGGIYDTTIIECRRLAAEQKVIAEIGLQIRAIIQETTVLPEDTASVQEGL